MKIIFNNNNMAVKLFVFSITIIALFVLGLFFLEYFYSVKKMTDEEVFSIFNINNMELKKIIPLCHEHPALHRIWKRDEVSFYPSPPATRDDYEAAQLVRSIIAPLDIEGPIQCSRRFDIPGDTFLGVNFAIYARGLSISGEAKAIWFSQPGALFEESEGYKARIKTGELKPLPEPGWYIYSSR